MWILKFSTVASVEPLGWKVRYLIFALLISAFLPTAILMLIVGAAFILTNVVMFLTSLTEGGRFKRILNYEFFKNK